jgi:hypothetical protein
MILSSHGIIASQIASFDADAVAFFNRVTTAGGSLSLTEKQAVNQLVLDLKANSLWTPMKAIYPMVGASAAACAQNLKSASFTGVFNGGWTFASTGVTPNGTNAYMDTCLNASTHLTTSSGHLSYYSRTNAILTGWLMGAETTAADRTQFIVRTDGAGAYYGRYGSNTIATINGTTSLGLSIFNRPSSSDVRLYQSSGLINTTTYSASGLPNLTIYLAGNNSGGTANAFCVAQCACASIGDGLTDTQASNFYTAVQAFQTTLGRQV